MLTFAIKPVNFVDDGEAAYLALKEAVEAEKMLERAKKKTARMAGLPVEEEDDEE